MCWSKVEPAHPGWSCSEAAGVDVLFTVLFLGKKFEEAPRVTARTPDHTTMQVLCTHM